MLCKTSQAANEYYKIWTQNVDCVRHLPIIQKKLLRLLIPFYYKAKEIRFILPRFLPFSINLLLFFFFLSCYFHFVSVSKYKCVHTLWSSILFVCLYDICQTICSYPAEQYFTHQMKWRKNDNIKQSWKYINLEDVKIKWCLSKEQHIFIIWKEKKKLRRLKLWVF